MTTATVGSRIEFSPIGREKVLTGTVRSIVTEQREDVAGYWVKVEGFNYFVSAADVKGVRP